MRILVMGAGMYVTGRGTSSMGTVLPAVAEWSRQHDVQSVTVCGTTEAGRRDAERAFERINTALGTSLRCSYRVAEDVLTGLGTESYDCAIVCVPDHLHHDIAHPLLSAGVHVQVVKPLSGSLEEAQRLTALAREKRLHGRVEFHKRLDEQNLVVKRLIMEGALGELSHATVEYSQRISVPTRAFRSWTHRTNVFQYLGVHYVDLFYFLTDLRPVRVMAVGTRGVLAGLGVEAFDSMHAVVFWGDKATSPVRFLTQFAVGWIDPDRSSAMSDQRYRLVGGHGQVVVDQKNRGLDFTSASEGVAAINPYFSQLLASEAGGVRLDGYGPRSVMQFLTDVARLRDGRISPEDLEATRPTFADALVSTAVLEAVNESVASGGEWRDVP